MVSQAVKRIFVEKKSGFDIEAQGLVNDLRENLGVNGLTHLRIINRYDISGLNDEEYRASRNIIFAEPPLDWVYDDQLKLPSSDRVFAMEYLPGQYDQRADSAAQCVQILTQHERPNIASAKVIVLTGQITEDEFTSIKNYCINPVESREASLEKPESLEFEADIPPNVETLDGFINKTQAELEAFLRALV